ncbi:MAG: hypothetical protein QXS76_00310 [Candidatus Bathyarchaeia archaeon]
MPLGPPGAGSGSMQPMRSAGAMQAAPRRHKGRPIRLGQNLSLCNACGRASRMTLVLGPLGAYAKCLSCLSLEFIAPLEDLGKGEERRRLYKRFNMKAAKLVSAIIRAERRFCPSSMDAGASGPAHEPQ